MNDLRQGCGILCCNMAHSASSVSLMAILAPFFGSHINDVTTMVASLGVVETHRQQKGV